MCMRNYQYLWPKLYLLLGIGKIDFDNEISILKLFCIPSVQHCPIFTSWTQPYKATGSALRVRRQAICLAPRVKMDFSQFWYSIFFSCIYILHMLLFLCFAFLFLTGERQESGPEILPLDVHNSPRSCNLSPIFWGFPMNCILNPYG